MVIADSTPCKSPGELRQVNRLKASNKPIRIRPEGLLKNNFSIYTLMHSARLRCERTVYQGFIVFGGGLVELELPRMFDEYRMAG